MGQKGNKAHKAAYLTHSRPENEDEEMRIKRRKFFFCAVLVSTLILFLRIFNVTISSNPTTTTKKMPLKIVDATLSTFDQVFKKFISEAPNNRANFILFLADKDPSTNLSWCPDCVRAEPVIYKKLEAVSDDVALLRAYVGDRPSWRNPAHPWRNDPRFKLRGVPTLVRWENEAVTGRLEDYEAHLETKIDTLIPK
ncbi:hypothetical protein QQ045_004251 [Rhodiola kirilowii]